MLQPVFEYYAAPKHKTGTVFATLQSEKAI